MARLDRAIPGHRGTASVATNPPLQDGLATKWFAEFRMGRLARPLVLFDRLSRTGDGAQGEFLDLAGGCLRNLPELKSLRDLEPSEMFAAEVAEFFDGGGRAGF